MSLADNRLAEPLSAVLARAPAGWRPVVDAWRASPAGRALVEAIEARQGAGAIVYPAAVLRTLELTPPEDVRVVVLGQDPYHGPGQAEGLAFSVPAGQKLPPSLRNIARELQRDLGLEMPTHGHLGAWARQGVLLLNTCLTVEDGRPAVHAKLGWEVLTDDIVRFLAWRPEPKVFMLWGAHALSKATLIEGRGHLGLRSNHPSPLSAGRPPLPFIGNGHFSAANRFLQNAERGEIDWTW